VKEAVILLLAIMVLVVVFFVAMIIMVEKFSNQPELVPGYRLGIKEK